MQKKTMVSMGVYAACSAKGRKSARIAGCVRGGEFWGSGCGGCGVGGVGGCSR